MNVCLIGAGLIGSELERKAKERGWTIHCVVRSDGVYRYGTKIDSIDNYHLYVPSSDVGFLAIPTKDDGVVAYNYLRMFLMRDKPIITCEKGALSNYFREVEHHLQTIGYSATVGGGSRLLRYAEEIVTSATTEIHAVINGTLNYVLSELSKKRTLNDILSEAHQKGYTEPGATEPLDVLNAEATGDIPRKAVILFNVCRLTKDTLQLRHIPVSPLGEKEYNALVADAPNRRYIVSITKGPRDEDVIGGFCYRVDDWVLSAGFKDISSHSIYKKLLLSNVDNGIVIKNNTGVYTLSGPGAGPGPTTDAMIADAVRLCK